MSEKIKALFPEEIETITISKDDYDRLYGQLTYENIILQEKVEQLENIRKEAIEYIENNTLYTEEYDYDEEENLIWNGAYDYKEREDLLNILNKGSEDSE